MKGNYPQTKQIIFPKWLRFLPFKFLWPLVISAFAPLNLALANDYIFASNLINFFGDTRKQTEIDHENARSIASNRLIMQNISDMVNMGL